MKPRPNTRLQPTKARRRVGKEHSAGARLRGSGAERDALEVSEITAAWVQGLAISVSQVPGRQDTERAERSRACAIRSHAV